MFYDVCNYFRNNDLEMQKILAESRGFVQSEMLNSPSVNRLLIYLVLCRGIAILQSFVFFTLVYSIFALDGPKIINKKVPHFCGTFLFKFNFLSCGFCDYPFEQSAKLKTIKYLHTNVPLPLRIFTSYIFSKGF